MKKINLLKLSIALVMLTFIYSCGKKSTTTNTNTNPTTQAPYYFNFLKNGVQNNYRSNTIQTGHGFDQSQIGGYVLNGDNIASDALGFTIYKRNSDSLSHQEVLAMVGKTYYYDDVDYSVNLNLQEWSNGNYENFNTIDENNHNYKITINSVSYGGTGTSLSKYNYYLLKGTCSGKLENDVDTTTRTITNGEFYARLTKGIK